MTIYLFKVKENVIENKEETKVKEIIINVNGMMCNHCKAHVEKALLNIEGVIEAEANLEKNNVTIKYNGDIERETFISAIVEAGYEAQ